jgi:hypothetical protein
MSNLWRLKMQIGIDENSITWPAVLEAEFRLTPADFFDRPDPEAAKTCISGETKFKRTDGEAKIEIERTQTAAPLRHRIEFDKGYVSISGAQSVLKVEVDDISGAAQFVDWAKVLLSQFLSVQLGVYSEMTLVRGTISGVPFTISFPGNSYCSLVSHVYPEDRVAAISNATNLVFVNSPSYPRYVTSCFYYQHALRLLSPHEVSFPPYTILSEVMLNLVKCIECLFGGGDRDTLRPKLKAAGFSEKQIDSQLLSILVVRSNFDVGHSSSGASTTEQLGVLRRFASRSVTNVRALLLVVASQIKEDANFLKPLSEKMSKDNRRILRRIEESLSEPPLPSASENQIFISAQVG